MKERKPLKKKESNLKYILLVVAIVLSIGYIAYEKSNINLKDIELFKNKDKTVNVERTSDNNMTSDIIAMGNLENLVGTLLFLASIGLFLGAITFFILPLFRGRGTGIV